MTNRISLAEASRKAPAILGRGDSSLLEAGASPTFSDLAGALQFALGDGRIWLNDERMVLMQTSMLGQIRSEMIKEMGMDGSREALMRIGWEQGVHLAELVRKRFGPDDVTAALAAGPRLHTMEGFAKVAVNQFEFDASAQTYEGEFYWYDSTEGVEHMRNLGICDCPVCWMQLGVPSGYSSTLLGYPVIFRELDCVAMGAARCVVVGKDAAGWGDDVPELAVFGFKATRPKGEPWRPPADVPAVLPMANAGDVIGSSVSFTRARRQLERVASNNEPVLLLGETGTGKEHFARHLHRIGPNPDGPFIAVNCALFDAPDLSADQALFGLGGSMDKAKGGTLFLNDILSLPAGQQAQLASYIQGKTARKLPVRVVSATGEQPMDAVMAGKLRSDLYYLLSLLPIHIPALRERRDDLPELIEHFFALHRKRHRKTIPGLSAQVIDVLLRYDYPGNLRELSNMVERGILYAEPGGQVELNHVFTGIERPPRFGGKMQREGEVYKPKTVSEVHSERTLEEIERETLLSALFECDWNISAAARKLGLTRAKLDYRVRKFNLTPPD